MIDVDETIRERLLKVLRLAQQGVGGEKENAEALLAKLLRKHGLTRADLEEAAGVKRFTRVLELTARNMRERTILIQLIERFVGRDRELGQDKRTHLRLALLVTDAEYAALTIAWEVYRKAWQTAVDDLAQAFIVKHRLWDPVREARAAEDDSPAVMTPEIRRVLEMAGALSHVDAPLRRLAAGGGA